VFVEIGLVPNSNFVEGLVELNKHGEILVDNECKTNIDGIFAAGDITSVPYKQIIIAGGEGAKAALSACDYVLKY
jgi:alkyl hydroperoxide reductase subunit F